ncbi:MAG: GTP 3',8-cyclase MoaA [Thermomicrobiales bacterium]|nr:GTP 3',8-cyclase MoaA [Thermomicrobiales bacterium]
MASVQPLSIYPNVATATGPRDQFGRTMNYLRISLTDRCNFRCLYCMPPTGMQFQPKDEMLTDDELVRLVGIFAREGVTKLRLTGGEPTIRPHLTELIREFKSFPGINEIAMTTNALLLSRKAQEYKDAGLDRVNVSIDTLDPARFRFMTRGGRLDLVWEGIEQADAVGLGPIKLNSVVVKDHNQADVLQMARLTLDRPWQVRFLEIMPMEGVGMIYEEGLVTSAETRADLEAEFGPLEQLPSPDADPAKLWRIPGARGTIGFISPMSEPFCETCNRIRLTADGNLRLCLLHGDEVNLRDLLRAGGSDDEIGALIREGVWRKPWGHAAWEEHIRTIRGMSQIGG